MTEWREFKIKDIADVVGGGTPSTAINEYWNGDIPWLTPKDLTGYIRNFISHGERFITKKGLENSSARLLPKGTVLLTSRAPIGYVAIAENEICTNQGFKSLVPNPDKAHNLFLLYWIKSNVEYLQSIGTGTTFQEISGSVLKDVDIILPPLPEQKAIAEVLSSLDDKIDLLTRQNKTLEDLAQAYFRKWFIEDASKEWEVVPISEKFDVLLGGTPSRKIESYWTNGTIGWINSGKINEFRIIEASEYITEEALNNSSAKLLPAGTTVLAITGATLGKISMVLRSFAANQSVIGLVPKAELSNNFIFLWLKENINALISMQTGGAQQHINSNDVKSFDVIVPDTVALSLFRRKIDPLMLKISQNCFQINTLNKLRDTLLPKLISGEIRVKM
jgi:type I restriction enzyme S subunit